MSVHSSGKLKKNTLSIKQLQALTGVNDSIVLNEALEKSRGDLSSAIKYIANNQDISDIEKQMPDLTGRRRLPKGPGMAMLSQTPMETNENDTRLNVGRSSKTTSTARLEDPLIDLTDGMLGEDADLQRAIKLSMECSSPSTSSDSQNIPPRNRNNSLTSATNMPEKPRDTSDPNLRRRKTSDWPVGLKNVGNTCWFSAVVQSLFNLPIFRNLILHYKAPSKLPPQDSEAYRNICFMEELKKLFALMIGTNQSYVDPSKCVDQLKGSIRDQKVECEQQDVSEFTHKLLDWLEDALKHEFEPSAEDQSTMEVDNGEEASGVTLTDRNPMVDLFYGEYKAHGINNGNSFTTPQKFGLFPLYVHEVDDLHQSLEYSTRDLMKQDGKSVSLDGVGQELWFTSLPPVLIFELSRFHYNKKSAVPEKIHTRLDFPNVLYMDRYMEDNVERTRQCREDCQKLQETLRNMKAELKSKRKMTLGEKSYPILDILQCCSQFAASRRKRYLQDEKDAHDESSPTKRTRGMQEDSDQDPLMTGAGDAPHLQEPTSDTEIKIAKAGTVEQCLRSWIAEIEEEKEGLRDDINDIQMRLESMYDDPALKNHPYVLHAVLVHQGHAVAGHYWAYVRDHSNARWLKFNDTNVTEAKWDELVSDSMGGGNSIESAYCLIYIDQNRRELLMGTANGEKEFASDKELQETIEKHNAEYSNEVEDWDIRQATMLSLTGTKTEEESFKPAIPSKGESQVIAEGKEMTPLRPKRERKDSLSSWDTSASREAIDKADTLFDILGPEETTDHDILDLTFQASMLAIAKVADTFNMEGPDYALLKVVKEEWNRLKELSEKSADATSDPRLQHIAVYLFKNHAPRKIIERVLLEQFADSRMSYDLRATEIMKCAQEKLNSLSPEDLNNEEFLGWQRNYRNFCRATCFLIRGLELCQENNHAKALPYLANVKVENDRLIDTMAGQSSEHMLADWDLAVRTLSICIDNIHKEALRKFQSEDKEAAIDGLSLVEKYVVPWMHLLTDDPLLMRIRNDWCTEESTDLQDQLESALCAVLDPPTQPGTEAAFHTPALIRPLSPQDLCERFQNAMSKGRIVPVMGNSSIDLPPTVFCGKIQIDC